MFVPDVYKRQIEMCHATERAIELSVSALKNRDVALAKNVIADDTKIDAMERDIEQDCLNILLLEHPFACLLYTSCRLLYTNGIIYYLLLCNYLRPDLQLCFALDIAVDVLQLILGNVFKRVLRIANQCDTVHCKHRRRATFRLSLIHI